jgi:hypothetical protein
MLGLELGFEPDMRDLAEAMLAVQEARYRETGQITMVSEDAVSVPPYYFYYYCVLCNGREFTVDVADPGEQLDEPRWISTKATFGWHALMPGAYTRLAIDAIAVAHGDEGWSSGVFEKSGASTETYDINTATIILESALYVHSGSRPILEAHGIPW